MTCSHSHLHGLCCLLASFFVFAGTIGNSGSVVTGPARGVRMSMTSWDCCQHGVWGDRWESGKALRSEPILIRNENYLVFQWKVDAKHFRIRHYISSISTVSFSDKREFITAFWMVAFAKTMANNYLNCFIKSLALVTPMFCIYLFLFDIRYLIRLYYLIILRFLEQVIAVLS